MCSYIAISFVLEVPNAARSVLVIAQLFQGSAALLVSRVVPPMFCECIWLIVFFLPFGFFSFDILFAFLEMTGFLIYSPSYRDRTIPGSGPCPDRVTICIQLSMNAQSVQDLKPVV